MSYTREHCGMVFGFIIALFCKSPLAAVSPMDSVSYTREHCGMVFGFIIPLFCKSPLAAVSPMDSVCTGNAVLTAEIY